MFLLKNIIHTLLAFCLLNLLFTTPSWEEITAPKCILEKSLKIELSTSHLTLQPTLTKKTFNRAIKIVDLSTLDRTRDFSLRKIQPSQECFTQFFIQDISLRSLQARAPPVNA
ncbi:MAG: hypothetical protein U0T83_08355 [Bacteriovoracaceae bacterium]